MIQDLKSFTIITPRLFNRHGELVYLSRRHIFIEAFRFTFMFSKYAYIDTLFKCNLSYTHSLHKLG